MVKDTAAELPPGAGLETTTFAFPLCAMSAAPICAVSCPLLTKVVGRLLPFHSTTEADTKFAPLTVRVNAAPPPAALAGERLLMDGLGLGVGVGVGVGAGVGVGVGAGVGVGVGVGLPGVELWPPHPAKTAAAINNAAISKVIMIGLNVRLHMSACPPFSSTRCDRPG